MLLDFDRAFLRLWALAFVGLLAVGWTACSVARSDDGVAATVAPVDQCTRVDLEPRPTWVFSGLWRERGAHLVLPDPGAQRLWLYDRAGRSTGTVQRTGSGALDFNRPVGLWALAPGELQAGSAESAAEAVEEQLLLLSGGAQFVWLDGKLEPQRAVNIDEVPPAPAGTVHAVFAWATPGDRIFGAGDALLPDGSWQRGLFVMPVVDPAAYRVVRDIPVEDRQEFDFFLMGDQLITVLGDKGYFLVPAETPHLLEVDGEGASRRLASFPAGFERRPAFPLHGGFESAEIRYRAYEGAPLAVGLYTGSRAPRLFVLTRRPAGDAGTEWTMTRIDPAADRIEGSLVLPTHANHLTLVPGPERWAILEKGRVRHYGEQDIATLLLVPTAWIEGEESPLATGAATKELCLSQGD